MLPYLLILIIVGADQLSKYLVRGSMALNESIPIADGILNLTYIQNDGAAFSILRGQTLILIALPLLVSAVFLYLLIKKKDALHPTAVYAFACIVAGGVGNLIDRALFGSVTDFIDFRVWPVFNVADIAVSVGCGLLLLYALFFDKGEKKAEESEGEG